MNPYNDWLGINCDGIPDHFRLLGVSRDDTDLDTIKSAAKLQLKKLKKHNNGPHAELAASTSERVQRAFRVISNPDLRQEYLEMLNERDSQRSSDASVAANPADEIVVPLWAESKTPANNFARAHTSRNALPIALLATATVCTMASVLVVGVWWYYATPSERLADSTAPSGVTESKSTENSNAITPETTDVNPAEFSEKTENDPGHIEVTAGLTNDSSLALKAKSILKANCFSCHGEAGEEEGGFGAALDREKLVAAGHVIPGDPDQSVLLERMLEEDSPMPPSGEDPRPTEEDIDTIRRWIIAGAQPFDDTNRTQFVSRSQRLQQVTKDLQQQDERDRAFMRYFTLAHLANAGDSAAQIETGRQAIAKLFNSLSRNRKLASLNSIEGLPSVYRVDLREVAWDSNQWNIMLLDYPFGVISESEDLRYLQRSTNCELPIVRGDWFVQAASRPPLYHDLLKIPNTDRELEEQLEVNVVRNLRQDTVNRIGFARSGVSQNNRLIERHESAFGAYWKSYDFAGNIEQQNLFEHPLGPQRGFDSFRHDGGEIIFQLPNGMLGYMLTDEKGNRIDRGPTNIVSDPRQPDRAVINGVSCMSCHYGGFIPKADEIRKHVIANKNAYEKFDRIMSLYKLPEDTNPKLESDTNKYLQALANSAIGIDNATRSGEPVVLVSTRFSNEVDATMAAAELGLEEPDFEARLAAATDVELIRQIGVLKTGGVVKRETFDDLFARMIRDFGIGSPTKISTSTVAILRARERSRTQDRSVWSEIRNVLSSRHFQIGLTNLERRQWDAATKNFELSLKHATDSRERDMIYQHLIPLYEWHLSTVKLINAHKRLMSPLVGISESERAHDQFFDSLARSFTQKKGQLFAKPPKEYQAKTLSELSPINSSLEPKKIQNLGPAASLILKIFERSLAEDPDHLPSLMILRTVYRELRGNESQARVQAKIVLLRLKKIQERQGITFSVSDNIELAKACLDTGDYQTAASLYQQTNATSRRTFFTLKDESTSWEKLGDPEKAREALVESWEMFLIAPPAKYSCSQLIQLSESFLRLNAPDSAIKVLNKAYQQKNCSKWDRKNIKRKLALAYSMSNTIDRKDSKVKKLLDKFWELREDAAELEQKKAHSPEARFRDLLKASQMWLKAKDNDKALAALEQADEIFTKTKHGLSATRYHMEIGKIYREVGEYPKALVHFTAYLQMQNLDTGVETAQKLITSLLEGENALEKDDKIKAILDPLYKHRVAAKILENKQATGELATWNLAEATNRWSLAKAPKEVERCGTLAEAALEKSAQAGTPSARDHAKLANTYSDNKFAERARKQYELATKRAATEPDVKKYYRKLQDLCQHYNLPMPEFEETIKQKISPRFKYQELAKSFEQKAIQKPETAADNLIQSLENWLKAGEKQEAKRVASQIELTLKNADKHQNLVGQCLRFCDLLVHMNDIHTAKKYYLLATESNPTPTQTTKIQESLSNLNEAIAK